MTPARRESYLAAIPLLAVAIACVPRINWILPEEDASVIAAWAMQVAAGQVPYRDFFMFTAPGSVLLYAAVFKVAGASVLVERLTTVVAILAATWALYEVGRRLLPWRWAAAVAVLWAAWLGVYYQYGPHHYWSTVFLLLAGLAVLDRRFVLAGVAAALAAVFLQTAALASAFCVIAAVMVERDPRRSLLPMLGAAVATVLPFAAWIVSEGLAGQFWTETVRFSLDYYPRANSVPFPWLPNQLHDAFIFGSGGEALWLILFGWPLVVLLPLVIAVYAVVEMVRRGLSGAGQAPLPLVVAILSTGLFAAAIPVRLTAPLAWFAAPLAFVLLAVRVRRLVANRRAALVPLVAFAVTALVPFPMGIALSCDVNPHGWRPISVHGGSLCAPRDFAAQMQGAYDFTVAHPGVKIAYLPVAVSYYLVTGEVPPVPNAWIVPVLTTPGQLDTLEHAMTQGDVAYVFYFEMPNEPPSPNGQADFNAVLARNYERSPADDAGGLPAWRRRS